MNTLSRPLRRHAELERLLHPKSIAIIGASPRPSAFGAAVLRNLGRFEGPIWLVNSRYAKIGDSGNPAPISADIWMAAEGWDLLFPGSTDERALGRANMERSLERLTTILEGLV